MNNSILKPQSRRGWEKALCYAERNEHHVIGFVHDGFESDSEVVTPSRLMGGCSRCGMRVVVHLDPGETNHALLIEGAATVHRCDENRLRCIETRAWLLGESEILLESRLQQEINELSPELQQRFDPGEFQIELKRWVSDDGMIALQWKLRELPFHAIDDQNRQGPWGVIERLAVVPAELLLPASYQGPIVNPNEDNSQEWLVEPLETGETGLAYQDDLGHWRLKREDGTTGFYVEPQHIVIQRAWLDVEPKEEDQFEPSDPTYYP